MFRAAAATPYDESVAKATDENLTSEDWGAIIEVCDKVTTDTNGPKEVVQSLIKRLAHRNANVQLYTLELAHALSQNCGKNLHRELSSRAFTDALYRLASDRNTHTQVKAKILERMKEWSDMFGGDFELGLMNETYSKVKRSNPTLQAPSAPQKQGLTDVDRQKEEDELQMALKLSLQEEERKKAVAEVSNAHAGPSQPQQDAPAPPVAGTTAATVSRVRALYDFVPSEPGELEFNKGDVISVLESVYKDWWRGSLKGKTGIFPLNYVEKLNDPTWDELQREAQMETEVFAEIKNVEKLLTLLSTSNTAPREEDNEEISKLYHQTLAIRPKLIKLIEKYSQKKDDFTQLNEKFIKARRDYEALLESSMAHPPQHSYQQYAMRPAPPGQGYPPVGGGYAPQGPPQQDPTRFYTPAPPQGDQAQYQTSSPPPNFQQQPPQAHPQAAAPFFLAGAEVPPSHPGGPPPGQQYAPPDQNVALNNKQPAPINTSPPAQNNYGPYSQPPAQASAPWGQPPLGRPTSTYGAQELATSVYDSPIAPKDTSTAPHSSSGHLPEDQPNNTTSPGPYNTQPPQHQPPQPPAQYQGYNPEQSAPPPDPSLAPAPLQLGGQAYDARLNPPSHAGAGPGPGPGAGAQPQYRPYVPPSDAASAPSAPAPSDYYRQNGVY